MPRQKPQPAQQIAGKPCTICGNPAPETQYERKTCSTPCARELRIRNQTKTNPLALFSTLLDCGCSPNYTLRPNVHDQVWCARCDGPAAVESVTRHAIPPVEL